MSISNLYAEYAKLDAEIKERELKKEQLRPHILSMMVERGQDKVDIGVGTFSRFITKKWKYTKEVDELADMLKARKAFEESTGEAELEEGETFRYTTAKL